MRGRKKLTKRRVRTVYVFVEGVGQGSEMRARSLQDCNMIGQIEGCKASKYSTVRIGGKSSRGTGSRL